MHGNEAGFSNRAQINESYLQPRKREPVESVFRTEHVQRLRNVEKWNSKCVDEAGDFEQQASHFEYEFSKALQSTDHLGVPNPLRTAICFDVLTKISSKFPRFQNLTRVTRAELGRSAFMNDSSQMSAVTSYPIDNGNTGGFAAEALKESLARRAYFTELKEVLLEKRSLELRLSRLDSLHQFMLKRLRNNELMVDRLASRWGRLVMRQTLADWKKIIIRKKYTRVLLDKTRSRWTKQHLMRLFRRWNDYAVAEKARKSNEQIQLYRDSKHDFQELIGRLQAQVEGAKVETKAHREHLDLAKRHTLSLEELLAQLELRIRQSQERKLQSISNQWGKLCFAFVDCECDYLQNMLDAVSAEEYVDVSVLLMKGEDDSDLLALSSELLVLRWINFQLEQCGGPFHHLFSSNSDLVQNFSSDMHGYYALRHILHRVLTVKRRRQPAKQTRMKSTFSLLSRVVVDNMSTKQTPFPTREELRTVLARQLDPACPEFVCDHVLSNELASDFIFCLFGFLVCEHPSLVTQTAAGHSTSSASPYPWYEAQIALNDARSVWDSVRVQWRELHTPFDVLEAASAPPEMSTSPQLLAKANIALQNAVNTVQYACSKRSSVMRVWGCLQRRIQQDALRLLARRGREQTPFQLVDRRVWRNKYMLTTLHISKLVQMFLDQSDNKRSSEELTEELQLIQEILGEHYERLLQIYRFYANVDFSRTSCADSEENQPRSGGNAVDEARFFHKISASMSLGEFYFFLKECQVFGKTRSFPYDFVQSVFEKVSPDVAASTDTAGLTLPLTHTLSAPIKDLSSVKGREMTSAEFVEALTHIIWSDRVHWKGENVGPTTALSLRFRRFLEEIVFPNAMRPDEEKTNVFRPQLLTFECREVFTTHHKKIRSMYLHFVASEVKTERRFANQDSAGLRGSSKMLSANGFVNCCQYFDLFRDNLLHFDDIQHILAETLQLERESVHFDLAGATTDSETRPAEPEHKAKIDHPEGNVLLTLTEFLEALAAVACYLNPDAFVPLALKLDAFFSERLESSAITSSGL
ncbi:hypothetical protein F442_17124 [Phytophthora nicotianae P10297]|uniref:Calponin-homology (CH) domain-containing protein n=7 Tax=Phytophthora nicotianae TaxID=4792 RepID=W2YID8_PHYNI|nr:hypothetical protein L917_16520 [Phytophthora nicotianae]ETO65394.1 hypothetical protein F444_17292 [Phytophthora nicotianae P1976]ETP34587.1 hypothetical protein F442_17124 [Phytophthora nicotianae P10297]KUG01599.1 hypothetical protein AM587_10007511 [Phytophthora nicotianae]